MTYRKTIGTNSSIGPNQIVTKVTKNIEKYSDSIQLNKYGARFKYSKIQKLIDDSDYTITSNITTVNIRRDLKPELNRFAQYEICFKNTFHVKNISGYNIKSSGFRVSGISNTVYLGDIPDSGLKTGKLFLFYLNTEDTPIIIRRNIGTIDYIERELKLNAISILSTDKYTDDDEFKKGVTRLRKKKYIDSTFDSRDKKVTSEWLLSLRLLCIALKKTKA